MVSWSAETLEEQAESSLEELKQMKKIVFFMAQEILGKCGLINVCSSSKSFA